MVGYAYFSLIFPPEYFYVWINIFIQENASKYTVFKTTAIPCSMPG